MLSKSRSTLKSLSGLIAGLWASPEQARSSSLSQPVSKEAHVAEPAWLIEARKHVGLKEIPGARHNTVILGWLARLKAWWRDDETPWCGVFVAHCVREAGLTPPKHWYRAKAWADWGSALKTTSAAPGAVLVFARQGGGHVGFYVGEDATYFYVLGGNQSNSVNVMKLAKARCIAIRWPTGVPVTGKPIRMAGGVVSTNEA